MRYALHRSRWWGRRRRKITSEVEERVAAADLASVRTCVVEQRMRPSEIESRKVFYRSNRNGKDGKLLEFATDLPLWPGSNMVTVVGRASSEVRSVETMCVYRDASRTAQAP